MRTIMVLLLLCFPVVSVAQRAWLNGRVAEEGHATIDGRQYLTATVLLYDPGNSSPLARVQAWVVMKEATRGKTRVELKSGGTFQGYVVRQTGELGWMEMRYVDDKGKERSERHLNINSLDASAYQ
jgi:hypothetical protein